MMIRKNIFISLGTVLGLWGALVFCFSFNRPVAQAAPGGLWGEYINDSACNLNLKKDEFKSLAIENIDFKYDPSDPAYSDPNNSFDQVIFDRTGREPGEGCAFVTWNGAIYADKAGYYNFHVDMNNINSHQQYYIEIDNEPFFSGRNIDKSKTKELTAGWHSIYISTYVYKDSYNSQFQLYWTPPDKEEEIIPAEKLSHKFWANNTITIPREGKAKINYVASGVGTLEAIKNGVDPKIEIALPVDSDKLLKNDVWIAWFSRNNLINKNITVTNENSEEKNPITITGTELLTEHNLKPSYPGMQAKIPAELIDDNGMGKLSFSFGGLGAEEAKENGIGIIIPYKDETMPEGQILLKMLDASAYRGVSPAFVFPLGEDMDKENDIHPLFFLADGETKESSNKNKFRPNYLMMLSGDTDTSQPEETTLLKKITGAKIIVPESNPINRSDANTWYPNYGREGSMFDVISSNYVPNQWTGKSTTYAGNEDGKISISVPSTHTWIAFQYYGTNFDEDGVDGSGESGPIMGGGLFSTLDSSTPNYTLEVTVNGNGNVTSDPVGIDNCRTGTGSCSGLYNSGTSITLTADPDSGSEFSEWSDDCSGTEIECTITMDSNKEVEAKFGLIPAVNGVCGTAINHPSCSPPEKNLCVEGTPSSVSEDRDPAKWKWVCKGLGEGEDVPCETGKYCSNWIEVAP